MKFLFIILILMGCKDAVQKSGGLRLSANEEDKTGILSTKIGDKEYGLAEIDFTVSSTPNLGNGIAIMLRTTSTTSFYACQLRVVTGTGDGDKLDIVFSYSTTGGEGEVSLGTLDVLAADTVGDHFLGCEIVKKDGKDTVNGYLDRELTGSYEIGSGTNDTLIETGKVGFGGYDSVSPADDYGTSIKINSFSFEE